MEKHMLVITAANGPDALARVSGLLAARGVEVKSIAGAPAVNRKLYRIRVVVFGTESRIGQIAKQIHKLVDTIKVTDVTGNRKRDSRRVLGWRTQGGPASV